MSQLVVVNHGSYSNGLITVNFAPPPNPIEMVLTNPANANIKGQGMGLTILSGGLRGSVLRIQPNVNATFEDLTITKGQADSGSVPIEVESVASVTNIEFQLAQ